MGGGVVVTHELVRGLRNRNPGNIKITSQDWEGKVPLDQNTDGTFEQFVDIAYGIRALSHILDSKYSRGLVTVDSIIRDYSATDQDAYVANVANALGVTPDQPIDLTDEQTKIALCNAIFAQELGALAASTIPDATIQRGIELA